jgi:hypothetical protein
MPVPGLTSLAVAVSRLAYRLAEKRRWLPGGAYHRMSVDRLKAGDLEEAERLNRLALARAPGHGKAQVVRDLIAMRRDASAAALGRRIDEERRRVRGLQAECRARRLRVARIERRRRRKRWSAWLLVPLAAAGALGTGAVAAGSGYPPWARVVAGAAGALLVLALVIGRFTGGGVAEDLEYDECRAAVKTITREIAVRQQAAEALERELNDLLGGAGPRPEGMAG